MICDNLDVDVWELIALANRHPRINILQPGPGVGGHCIAVDPWFIVGSSETDAKLIETARLVNDQKPDWVIQKVFKALDGILKRNKTISREDIVIACLGLSYKPNIDDLRESPALYIADSISRIHTGKTLSVEPNINYKKLNSLEIVSIEDAFDRADLIVLLVDHDEFKSLIPPNDVVIIDTKGLWNEFK
jgi:UDP-N-acetyl-D-mannosaminuronic acid dehydrogenase